MTADRQLLTIRELGRMDYRECLSLQHQLVESRKADAIPDTLLIVEHDPVFTLGRNADPANILASGAALKEAGVSVEHIERGGDVTYHGPGQIVGYPILRLGTKAGGALSYITGLEEVLIKTLAHFGVTGQRDPENRGVWIGNEKVAALGVRITRRVTMHGFALNVTTDLNYYRWIVPCGIADKGVTSLQQHAPNATIASVTPVLKDAFCEEFGYTRMPEPSRHEDDRE